MVSIALQSGAQESYERGTVVSYTRRQRYARINGSEEVGRKHVKQELQIDSTHDHAPCKLKSQTGRKAYICFCSFFVVQFDAKRFERYGRSILLARVVQLYAPSAGTVTDDGASVFACPQRTRACFLIDCFLCECVCRTMLKVEHYCS